MGIYDSKIMRDLFIFITVVEAGSLSVAARKIGVSTATVSKSIIKLEEHTGNTLLNRDTRGLEVTESGRIAYEKSKELIDALQSFLSEIKNTEDKIKGDITLSAPSVLCEELIGEWVVEFIKKNYETNVYLNSKESNSYKMGRSEFDDVYLKSGRVESDELVHRELNPFRMVICASPRYLNNQGRLTHPDELVKHSIIKLNHDSLSYPLVISKNNEISHIQPHGIKPCISSNNVSGLVNLTVKGYGICIAIPEWLALRYIEKGLLEIVLPGWRLQNILSYLVWRHRKFYTPLFKSFCDFIENKWNCTQEEVSRKFIFDE